MIAWTFSPLISFGRYFCFGWRSGFLYWRLGGDFGFCWDGRFLGKGFGLACWGIFHGFRAFLDLAAWHRFTLTYLINCWFQWVRPIAWATTVNKSKLMTQVTELLRIFSLNRGL
jgi:hypothetical protein